MNYGELVIREYVERCEEEYGKTDSNYIYEKTMKEVKQKDLGSITEKDVESDIVKPYLYDWGRMGRVLGRYEFWDWESKLVKQIRSNCETLEVFRTKDLQHAELSEFKTDIERLYSSFKEIVGRIGGAKVLHLLCPSLFPPWDNAIANTARKELAPKGKNKVENFSPQDYYRFMCGIQYLLKKYDEVLSHLATKYGRTKMRIVDECLWWAKERSLWLLFSSQ